MTDAIRETFSLLYLERGAPTRDSERFRNRVAAFYEQARLDGSLEVAVAQKFERETGSRVPTSVGGFLFSEVFRRAKIRDVLDAITIVYEVLKKARIPDRAEQWLNFVDRAMRETNVGYSIDRSGVVHHRVDEEFERNRVASIAVLEHPQFLATRAALDDAYRHLDADPQDTKASVRSMFESIEILARQVVPEARNLHKRLVATELKQKCLSVSGSDETERHLLSGLFDSMSDWVDAMHLYRHGQAGPDPVAPSLDTAVLILSTGTAYLRHLAVCAMRLSTAAISAP
jgi:hypothetical protein